MARRHASSASFSNSFESVWKATQEAIGAVANLVESNPVTGHLKATVGLSWLSWGEVIDVAVSPRTPPILVSVASRSSYPLTLVDWGKNERNVNAVLLGLQSVLSRSTVGQSERYKSYERLERLSELREKGVISEQDFEKQKRSLLRE